MPFRLALAFCAFLALLVSVWLFVGLVLLFGRAWLMSAHRRGPLGGELVNAAGTRAQEELPGEAGEAARDVRGVFDVLPLP